MKKYEYEYEKEVLKTDRINGFFGVIKTLIISGTIVWCLSLIMGALKYDATTGNIIVEIIDELNLGNVLHALVTASFGGLYYKERRGKKRAITKLGSFRKKLESNDPERTSSNLTSTGGTPKGEK